MTISERPFSDGPFLPSSIPDGYVPGVDDPDFEPLWLAENGTQSTQSTHVSSGFPLEGDGFVEPDGQYAESTYLTESTEFHPDPTAPT